MSYYKKYISAGYISAEEREILNNRALESYDNTLINEATKEYFEDDDDYDHYKDSIDYIEEFDK